MISSLIILFFGFPMNSKSLEKQHQDLMKQNLGQICPSYETYSKQNFFDTTLSQNQALCYYYQKDYIKALASSLRLFYLNPFLPNKIFLSLKNKFSFKHSFMDLFFIYTPLSLLAFLACIFLLLSFFRKSKIIFYVFSFLFFSLLVLKISFFMKPRWLALKDTSSFVTPFSSIQSYSIRKSQVLKQIDQKGDWLQALNSKGQKAWVLKEDLFLFWDLNLKNHLPNPKKQQ